MDSSLRRALYAILPAIFLVMLCCFSCLAQGSTGAMPPPEMADHLRSSGKIYVVVLTLALILAGVLTYLIKLDVKVKNLENEHSEGAK